MLGGDIPEGVSEEEVREMERRFKEAGGKIGVGGYDTVLLEEAERCALRARSAGEDGSSREEAGATAAAILCASAACEARLSEYLAHCEFAGGDLPEELARIRNNSNAREQWRDLLRHVRPEYELGTSVEYLRLGCLFRLRDLVAHWNARLMELSSFPEAIAPCVQQGTLPVREAENADWTSVVFVHEVATWAAETAAEWLNKAKELAPFVC